jgi:SAM-dependent methyltransferase
MNTIEPQTPSELNLAPDAIKATVRERYGQIAAQGPGCGCAPSCCQPTTPVPRPATDVAPPAAAQAWALGYSEEDTAAAPDGANLGLGCGNPHAIAQLRPGEVVLDLGSGAGFDAFLAARAVGPTGRVIGVDMTPEMLARARQNQTTAGIANVEFRLGEIEHLPVADQSIDVILSNCVVNLSPDKRRVFQEAFRVLKPGGRLAIADVVALARLPEALRREWDLYTGCVAGAETVEELEHHLKSAGFSPIQIVHDPASRAIIAGWFPGRRMEDYVASARIEALKPHAPSNGTP